MENIALTEGGPMYCLMSALLIGEKRDFRSLQFNCNLSIH